MLRFLVDEDFDHNIVRGLTLQHPQLDLLTIQKAERSGASDPANLSFAAEQSRILLTHDKRLVPFVRERVASGQSMQGVFVVHQAAPVGTVVRDLSLLALASEPGEWEGQVLFVPL